MSVVYSFALEHLNKDKEDVRTLQIIEDGTAMKIIVMDAEKPASYFYITLLVDGLSVALPKNDFFGFSVMNRNGSENWECRYALFEEL